MRSRTAIPLLGVGLLAIGILLATRSREPRYVSFTQDIMASPITVVAPEPIASEAAGVVFAAFRDIDTTMSEWKPGSPLAAVNAAAGREPVSVPADLLATIERGIAIGDMTDGAFDVTWAALWGLWDFKAAAPVVPDADAVRARAELVDYTAVVVDRAAGTVFLPRGGMVIGLGGIAKGTALDRAATVLRERDLAPVLITAGGQVMAIGRRSDRPWRVGIRDPRGDGPTDHFATLDLVDACMSTSGDYERYFELDGVRYHHVLDPRTGMPARGLRSATVIAADAELADALATAMLILGTDAALDLAARVDGIEVVLVDEAGGLHVSPGIGDRLHASRFPG